MQDVETVERVESYRCNRPKDVERSERCEHCTGRSPWRSCEWLKTEVFFRRKDE